MMTLLKVEWFKLKRSKIVYMTTVLTLFALIQGYQFARTDNSENAEEVFKGFLYQGSMAAYGWLILPLIITVIIAMIARIEHSSNGWKQLFALPVKRGQVYVAKLLISFVLIVYSLVLLYLGLAVAGHMLEIGPIPYLWMAKRFGMIFLSSLPIIGILFYVSYRFMHVGIPMTLGGGLAFPAMLVANSETYWIFYPWDYPIVSSLNFVFEIGEKGMIMIGISISIFLLSMLGVFRFRTKDIL
ncbi:hypothetical protein WQ54_14265 [Bacillus sp. SA1-12]|uniref:ABC transporter permease n=1 Tax=Bacillus sp. SA1-12 TaxID=1455638 RepID=UPI0006267561|nr:ABC transporter permease [Bacillus sp. SA1-12]KKI91553.1 hypothetical protein WQ54_14265 [Bacillus sp. SA1-12]